MNEITSKFLPGTRIQYAWDSTSIGSFKRCPRLYYYEMIEGWRPKGENVHLRFGTEFHQALHDYENSKAAGIKHEDALHDTIRALLTRTYEWEPEHPTAKSELKTKKSLVRTVVWYLEKYKDDPAKTVMLESGKPAVELSFKFELEFGPEASIKRDPDGNSLEGSGIPYLLCGHLDRVVTLGDDTFVMDRKTTTTTPGSYYFNQYEPENQMSVYALASQVIFNSPIRGVIIDVAQLLTDVTRFERGITYRTPDQLQEWILDLSYWLRQAEDCAERGEWPQNDTACDKYGGCRFREVCSKSPSVRDAFLKGKFNKEEPWNPLKPR